MGRTRASTASLAAGGIFPWNFRLDLEEALSESPVKLSY
jgi:hypothetical protein